MSSEFESKCDVPWLLETVKNWHDGRVVVQELANRKRGTSVTDAQTLYYSCVTRGVKISYADLLDVLRAFEMAGCGFLCLGRKGAGTRFVWSVPMLPIVCAVAKGNQPQPTKHSQPYLISHVSPNLNVTRVSFQFRLSQNRLVSAASILMKRFAITLVLCHQLILKNLIPKICEVWKG